MRALIGLLAPAFGSAAVLLGAAKAQELPAEAFGRLPMIESPRLSPDGTRIAHLMHEDGRDYLVVRNTSDFEPVSAVNTSEVKARGLRWADDDVVVLIASETVRIIGVRGEVELTVPFGVELAERVSVRQLMRSRQPKSYTRFNPNMARIVGVEPATGRLLIPDLNENDVDLFSVDPRTDSRRTAGRGTSSTYDWVVDDQGAPIVRIDYQQKRDRFTVRTLQGGEWRVVVEETAEIPAMNVLGLDPTGKLLVATRFQNPGRYGLYELSMETGAVQPYFVDDAYDVGDVQFDPYTNRVVGARVDAELPKAVWFDPEIAERQQEMEASFGGAAVTFLSWSQDRKKYLAALETGSEPTIFYLYDVESRSAEPLGVSHPQVFQAGLASRFSIEYPARDRTMIPAYLTMGEDLPQPAPLVVLPHGGPESRDVAGFDWLAHFIASRGYIVLQPNFRGSDGYGTAWRDAGRGQWGTGVMQHDISDGVAALVAEGYADPNRVCIVGGSYGGYAALAGAAFTPEIYRCAAAIAPVADLNDMIAYERENSARGSWVVDYWETVIGGDLGAARDRLAAMSPARNVESIRAPILLIHGRDDTVVPISQSRGMERALRRAGKSVELVELRGEDHWLSRAETRIETLRALDAFLAEHLQD